MNFDFDDDVKAMKEEAGRLLKAHSGLGVSRRVLESGQAFDEPLWRLIIEMGWPAVTIPEEYGGLGLGHLALCGLAEELGYSLSPVPFSSSVYLATEAILLGGSPQQKQKWLPELARGNVIGAIAIAEGVGAVNLGALDTRYENGTVTGVKIAVHDGDAADFVVVAAASGSGPVLCLVETAQSAVRTDRVNTIDPTRPQATLTLDGAKADPLGASGGGFGLIDKLIDRAAVPVAFEQIGGARAALDMARGYALQRYAFGRPIGSFQAIKHKLADIYSAIELARSNCYFAAWALSQNADELPVAAAVARASACDAFWMAARENVHVHGGLGYTWEFDCQFHFRRSQLLALMLGGSLEWKDRLVIRLQAAMTGQAARA